MGYKNVLLYSDGLPAWIKKGYPYEVKSIYPKPTPSFVSAVELKGMVDRNEDITILDIRDEDDRKSGWIKGSTAIDLEILDEEYTKIPKSQKVIIMDLRGKQTYIAMRFLTMKGFKNISMLQGGYIDSWLKPGMPIEK